MAISLYRGDLPADLSFGSVVAIDTETMGLNPHRDRLCLVQLSGGDGNAHLVQIPRGPYKAPRLAALLADPKVLKLFHFGRFDIAVLEHALGVRCEPVYCTKIAARLVRTFTDRFGLKDLCRELLGVDLVQAAADVRLGSRQSDGRAARLRRVGCPASACASRPRLDALLVARRKARAGRGGVQVPARPRAVGRGGLAGDGHFRTLKQDLC